MKAIEVEERNKVMMERKATVAEVVLSFVILCILTCSILLYSKLYKKDTLDERMIQEINAQVSQYFQLAGSDPTET